ncbi:MAG: leucine-rich repeat domain-containing protein, partial [Muribaculaceae bacterium]|nr:leucine-rich repeat domain-containing protein [Muribaculaceae bacterium]
MIRFLTFINLICCISAVTLAQSEATQRTQSPVLLSDCNSAFESNTIDKLPTLNNLPLNKEQVSEPLEISVTTTRAGELAELLGENWTQIETLQVEGPINSNDFSAMWSCAFDGHLKVLDLGKASVDDGIIPDYALFHTDVQVDWSEGYIYTIGLEKLILPGNTVEIGRHAFAYATRLTEIQFPETLKRIGVASFTD